MQYDKFQDFSDTTLAPAPRDSACQGAPRSQPLWSVRPYIGPPARVKSPQGRHVAAAGDRSTRDPGLEADPFRDVVPTVPKPSPTRNARTEGSELSFNDL